ncbi:winged helix-turn-helix transcriptional regulator [Isoalcanivorax indicus]|uniref:winged helix-turn-helix transcriptional regulator n=1 Tax=Isoalcanivorax indicus TaxID=2202653 RepID=UPI000DB96F23|nr:helix-turn-helix domain-containing protein [Isoalcanivorax indicus]
MESEENTHVHPDRSKASRPIIKLLELVGQRWTLRILWELRDGPQTFRALQNKCENISPSVLNSRLQTLRKSGIIELALGGYALTELGEELGRKLLSLTSLADRWAKLAPLQ